jgi:hypothetical protein
VGVANESVAAANWPSSLFSEAAFGATMHQAWAHGYPLLDPMEKPT